MANPNVFRSPGGFRIDTILTPEDLKDIGSCAIVRDKPVDYERSPSEAHLFTKRRGGTPLRDILTPERLEVIGSCGLMGWDTISEDKDIEDEAIPN